MGKQFLDIVSSLCVSLSQERLSFRRQTCVGMALTPTQCRTDYTSWIPAEGAMCSWMMSFTALYCQGNTNCDD